MKRSEINNQIRKALDIMAKCRFNLPDWASWTPEEWVKKGNECAEIRDCSMGWDITDFGWGDFPNIGLTLVTLRNGKANDPKYTKPYCEKIMIVGENQVTPYHFHWFKTEDIINRGGGTLCMKLYKADRETEQPTEDEITVSIDGVETKVKPGETIRIEPGQSTTYGPYLYHKFWGEGGDCLVGEVSTTNDDAADNRFLEPKGRFPEIEEDEAPFRLLCNEYPKAE